VAKKSGLMVVGMRIAKDIRCMLPGCLMFFSRETVFQARWSI
jgi:hypothetical protein